MTNIGPILNDRGMERIAAPGIENAMTFTRLRAAALLEAGVKHRQLVMHGLNDDDIVNVWRQAHRQEAAVLVGSNRYLGSFDEDDALIAAVEVSPVTDEYVKPFNSRLDIIFQRHLVRPEANSMAIFALVSDSRENRDMAMGELLSHVVTNVADNVPAVYFSVPTDSREHFVATEQNFEPIGKLGRKYGIPHTLLVHEITHPTTDGQTIDVA